MSLTAQAIRKKLEQAGYEIKEDFMAYDPQTKQIGYGVQAKKPGVFVYSFDTDQYSAMVELALKVVELWKESNPQDG